jgi:hypothetical protein
MDDTPWQDTGSGSNGINHPDKAERFRWILLLLRLVTTVMDGFPAWKLPPTEARKLSRFHTQSYGYLDTLTTLMLRRDEIVATAKCSPGRGTIMSEGKLTNTEVCWHLYTQHLTQIIPHFSQTIQGRWIQSFTISSPLSLLRYG